MHQITNMLTQILHRLVNIQWFKSSPRKPLGRWSQCGEKRTIPNVIEWKVHRKQRRLQMLEEGVDPLSYRPKKSGGDHKNR